jgi:uncharacterized protein (TIGR04255 family)
MRIHIKVIKEKDNMGQKYKEPFLKKVIFRIDLTQPLSQSKQLANDFYEIIKVKFPKKEDITGLHLEATMSMGEKDKGTVKQTQRTVTSYKFSDVDNKTILMLEAEPPNLNLLFNSYSGSDELNGLVNVISAAVNKVYGDTLIKRTGLRYINNINLKEGSAFDWAPFIDKHLISMLDFLPNDKGTISRTMGRLELNRDTYKVQFYFGLANPEYPNPIARKEFLLDYDCYSTEEINVMEVPKVINLLHEEVKSLFEKSILDGLREIMGVVKL